MLKIVFSILRVLRYFNINFKDCINLYKEIINCRYARTINNLPIEFKLKKNVLYYKTATA